MRVPSANRNVPKSYVIEEVFFLFHAHPAVEISGKYMIVMTIEILWEMRGGSMEIIDQIDGEFFPRWRRRCF